MSALETLQSRNPHIQVLPVTGPAWARYGRVLAGYNFAQALIVACREAHMRDEVVYEPSVAALEADETIMRDLRLRGYGAMPIQLGWCYGRNSRLDGLEYHKGHEISMAVTDLMVLVAHYDDIRWLPRPTLDAGAVRCFYIPQGTVYELYGWGLHFAPLHVHSTQGFCTLVALPRDTNLPLAERPTGAGEPELLFARNKWLLVHPDAEALVREGAYVGITGPNLCVDPAD